MKTMTLEELARYADAVTVARVNDVATGPMEEDANLSNETSVGNVAYVALNCGNEQIRVSYAKVIKTWQTKSQS